MKIKIWVVIGLFSIVMAACDGPVRATVLPTSVPGPSQTWIDAPLHNSNIPLLPYKLVFHGASFVGITEFEIQINGVVIATVSPVSTSSGGPQYGTLFLGEYNWNPPAPGTYLIQVRAKGNGQFSSPDQVQVTVNGGKITSLPFEPIPTITNTLVEVQQSTFTPVPFVPTPTSTLVEFKQCTYTAIINHRCRIGPGMGYEAIDNFIPGQFAPIVGQSTDGFFWYVTGPNYGELCTVPTAPKFGEADGNCDELPRFTPRPLPTPTYTPEPTARPAPLPTPTPR